MTSKNPNRKNFTADTSGSPGNAGKSNPKNSKSVGKNSGGNKYKDQKKSAPRSPSSTPDRSNSKPVDLPKPKNVGKAATPPTDAVDTLDSLKQPTGNGKQKISAPSAPVPKLNLDDVAQSDSVNPQDTLKSTLKSMEFEKSKITARMAQLEFDLVMGTAENGDTELLLELKDKLVKISELEKRYSPGGDALSLVNGTQTVSMNSGTARTAVETPSVQPRLFENGAADVFIERNSNPIHQILDFSNLGADTTFNSAPGTKD